MTPISRITGAVLACVAALPGLASAEPAIIAADIVPGWQAADGTHVAGLRLRMAPGWKTYWRAPGDAGIPPRFDFRGSGNLDGVEIGWPRPEVFVSNGMRSIGYSGEVILPLEIAPHQSEDPIRIAGQIDLGVCSDVCVPMSVDIAGSLPPGSTARPGGLVSALLDQPVSGDEAGVTAATCRIAPKTDGVTLTARVGLPNGPSPEFTVIEFSDPSVWVSEAETSWHGGELVAVSDMVPAEPGPLLVDRSGVTITLFTASQTIEIQGCSAG